MYEYFINPKYEILNKATNTSDHLAINMQFEYKIAESIQNNNEKTDVFRVTPDFLNPVIYNSYNKFIEEELVGIEDIVLKLKNGAISLKCDFSLKKSIEKLGKVRFFRKLRP